MASVTTPAIAASPPDTPAHGGGGPRRARRPLDLAAVFLAGAALGGWRLGLRRLADNSFFMHLLTGRVIVRSGIPRRDIYSFSAPGARWIAQSWLAEWVYGRLYDWWGGNGIRLFVAAVGAALFAGVYAVAHRITCDRRRAALVTLVVIGPVFLVFNERPLSLGLLALLGVVACVELPSSAWGRHALVVLPIVFWVWGNTHGSVALGFAYMALHLVGRTIEGHGVGRRGRERTLLVGTVLGALAMTVNPYGPALLWFPIELLGKGAVLKTVVEWMSPNFRDTGPQLFALLLAVTFIAFARGRRPGWRDVVVVVPFLLLGLWAVRNVAIAAVVTLPALARCVAAKAPLAPEQPAAERVADRRVVPALLGTVVLAAVVMTASALSQPAFDARDYSVGALRAMQDQQLVGRRLLTTDANAEYVLLKEWPRQKAFMDDRYDMYPRAVTDAYAVFNAGRPAWRVTLDRWGIDVVVWRRDAPLTSLLRLDPAWRVTYEDARWVLAVRR